eukprot:1137563-Pelagomonas_calceolata.AAC.6
MPPPAMCILAAARLLHLRTQPAAAASMQGLSCVGSACTWWDGPHPTPPRGGSPMRSSVTAGVGAPLVPSASLRPTHVPAAYLVCQMQGDQAFAAH